MGGRVETSITLRIPYSDAMLIYQLSQKLKLLGNGEFNHFNQNSIEVLHPSNGISWFEIWHP